MREPIEIDGQIDNYDSLHEGRESHVAAYEQVQQTAEAQLALHEGIDDYREEKHDLADAFATKYPDDRTLAENAADDSQGFRKAFMAHLQEHVLPKSDIDDLEKTENPEAALIQLEGLLGPKGVELYQLALQEEAHSNAFREAVFKVSSRKVSDKTWAKRPVLMVAGPSGAGKSYSQGAAFQRILAHIPEDSKDETGSYVVSVDGGNVREVSQMRKLVIQVARRRGFTGVEDLHSKSKVLEGIKTRVQEAVMATKRLGVAVPETFSHFISPTTRSHAFMDRVQEDSGSLLFFSRVEGKRSNIFQRVVAFMGRQRAWETRWGARENEPLPDLTVGLNNTDIAESKRYGAAGFRFGDIGSKIAERWYRSRGPGLNLIIVNDLILVSPVRSRDGSLVGWRQTADAEPGTVKMSARVFKAWQDPTVDKKGATSPAEFDRLVRDDFPPIIKTSAGFAAGQLAQEITENQTRSQHSFTKMALDGLKSHLERANFSNKENIQAVQQFLRYQLGRLRKLDTLPKQDRRTLKRFLTRAAKITTHAQRDLQALKRHRKQKLGSMRTRARSAERIVQEDQEPSVTDNERQAAEDSQAQTFNNPKALHDFLKTQNVEYALEYDEGGELLRVTPKADAENGVNSTFVQRPNRITTQHATPQTIRLMIRMLLIEQGPDVDLKFDNCSEEVRTLAGEIEVQIRAQMLHERTQLSVEAKPKYPPDSSRGMLSAAESDVLQEQAGQQGEQAPDEPTPDQGKSAPDQDESAADADESAPDQDESPGMTHG